MNYKKAIKHSIPYQLLSLESHSPISQDRFMILSEDEKTKQRNCLFTGDKVKQLLRMMKMVQIHIRPDSRYQMWLDTGLRFSVCDTMTDNIPPDYSLIIDHSIAEMKEEYSKHENKVAKANVRLLEGVEKYIIRVQSEIDKAFSSKDDERAHKTKAYFSRMITDQAETLEEAFQRILFWSSMFWQSRHRLVGLGRLDVILQRFADDANDIDVISDFLQELHRYYPYKSNRVTLGDTGQIIILGGKQTNGKYFCNELTYQFIWALMKINLPDPKLLLRVSSNMPDDLLKLAIECIATGIGCPLLSNDDVVIPALRKFGYTYVDACDYVTSACWEPVAYGKSLEKNNIRDLNYANAIVELYSSDCFQRCSSFEEMLSLYMECLLQEINDVKSYLDCIQWELDPLMTLFTKGCIEKGKDISEGGAVYSDYGILGVGLSNAINSLLNVKKLVFEQGIFSLEEIKSACILDYQVEGDIKSQLQKGKFYGKDDDEVVALTKQITEYTYENLHNYRNRFGGKVKWGLSSSNYLENGKKTGATADGRCSGEPLGVHISCQDAIPYTELISFASKLNYEGHRSNGNVVDFFVPPAIINHDIHKFLSFIQTSIKLGFFQMQMNVVDSRTLIDAKEHPENHMDLIVRVWGFSAYFNDLPDAYKDLLIQRSLQSEGAA